jgi:two-component system cell cycle sensor histidine kinase/response regulator CckA
LTSVIKKRRSIHKSLDYHRRQNNTLKFQLDQMQALANIGVVTCMIAHEINNLLTPLANYAALAMQHPSDAGLTKKALEKTVKNCQRASSVMTSMLAVANGKSQEKIEFSVRDIVDEIFTCLCRDFSKDRIRVKIDIGEDVRVFGIPIQIQQVLMNLIINARDAMLGCGGLLAISAQRQDDCVLIEVSDTGSGIGSEEMEQIFEPFFSTKKDPPGSKKSSGFGLGLAFCKKVIEGHNGSIKAESEAGRGCTFRISLPKAN